METMVFDELIFELINTIQFVFLRVRNLMQFVFLHKLEWRALIFVQQSVIF